MTELLTPHGHQVEDLTDVEDHADDRRSYHEVGEDALLCWPCDVTVYHVGTRLHVAHDAARHVKVVVDEVQQEEEGHLDNRFEEETEEVGPPQPSVLLPRVVIEMDVVAVFGLILAFALLPVRHVKNDHERWAGDEDELEGPETSVRDGEEVVVTDVGAAWLAGVAVKVFLVVAPHPLRCHHEHHDPKDEDDGQPDTTEARGVLVYPT